MDARQRKSLLPPQLLPYFTRIYAAAVVNRSTAVYGNEKTFPHKKTSISSKRRTKFRTKISVIIKKTIFYSHNKLYAILRKFAQMGPRLFAFSELFSSERASVTPV